MGLGVRESGGRFFLGRHNIAGTIQEAIQALEAAAM
jgi:hypothetical protein